MIVLPTESFQDYVEHPQVRRLYLTDVGFFPRAEHHYRERKDGIEEYILIYCTEGSGFIVVDGKEYILHENEAFCIPQYHGHRYYACEDDPWSILWVHFKGEDIKYFPLQECNVISFSSQNATNRMLFLFELLFRVLEANYTLGNFIYISQVLSLILAETYDREKHNTTLEQNKHVTNVVRFMYKHLEENLTLEEVAAEFELSKSYLNAIFQKYTQHAPMDFFINIKMKSACRLLKTTDLYIYEVAQKLGYGDQYYFSRIFKKVVGISPKAYKNGDYFHYKE
ncbi:MAG: AraC family transcriptional regulator [Clostridia bacterium]|nr:AraC family transcriptional regulator [Clostridia bacterium]NCC42024.1 AraC family transcriptional regulator [Clostridia bacterium]